MLLALLAQITLAQNPLAVTHPKATTGPIFHADDYPMEARRNLWSGTVIADLNVKNGVDAPAKAMMEKNHAKFCSRLI